MSTSKYMVPEVALFGGVAASRAMAYSWWSLSVRSVVSSSYQNEPSATVMGMRLSSLPSITRYTALELTWSSSSVPVTLTVPVHRPPAVSRATTGATLSTVMTWLVRALEPVVFVALTFRLWSPSVRAVVSMTAW